MKRLLIITLIALLIGASLVALIVKDPGYVLIAYGNYTLESSVWILLLGLITFAISFYILLRLVRSFLGSASFISRWFGGLSVRQASKYSLQGVVAILEGNYPRAKKLLVKSAPNVDQPLINYWLTTTLPGADNASRHRLVETFKETFPDNDQLHALLRAHLSLREEKFQDVIQELQPLQDQGKKIPAIYLILYQAYVGNSDWANAVSLLPMLHQYHLLEENQWLANVRRSYWQLFDPEQARHRDASGKLFRNAWDKRPQQVKEDTALLARYARCLMALDNDEDVEVLLRQWLDKHWHTALTENNSNSGFSEKAACSELVELYGMVEGADIKRQLKQAEKWLQQAHDHPQLLLTLGRLALRNQLWALARDFFEKSYRRQPRAETCAELARLLAHLGEPALSEKYYREGLINSIGGLPILPQPHNKNSAIR